MNNINWNHNRSGMAMVTKFGSYMILHRFAERKATYELLMPVGSMLFETKEEAKEYAQNNYAQLIKESKDLQ